MPALETDYLVVGAGAAGLAFSDSLVSSSPAQVLLVDRRHVPGGHWNDAYPFVRLHQPSAFYGVNSRRLGGNTIDQSGPNAGGYERACASEIRDYFQRTLNETLLATGRLRHLPLVDYVGDYASDHAVVSRLTGEVTEIRVRRRVVDARFSEPSIPSTHKRPFAVDGAAVIAPNDLVKVSGATGYTVIGAGKTAMDTCSWLLDNGVDADRIRWIRPRDPWMINRAFVQPLDLVASTITGASWSAMAVSEASSIEDLFTRLEEYRVLLRFDRELGPRMYRCATVSESELEYLRQITNVVRLGHVRRISAAALELDGGVLPIDRHHVHVDCTADGLTTSASRSVFEPTRITLQQVRTCQPTFNAALIGFVESLSDDDETKNRLCSPNPYPRDAIDWLKGWVVDGRAQSAWSRHEAVGQWLDSSRLNANRGIIDHASEPPTAAALDRFFSHVKPASANAKVLLSA